ncbi:MAG: N-acetylmuramic acid 6-phosphate etherase [Thermoflexales bacterium]|nr:N-acetylmuramic acid 6-phosphate etherase [Thermoflexales bacterium]
MTPSLPLTEGVNAKTVDIDAQPTLEILRRINAEDKGVADAVAAAIPDLARFVDGLVARMQRGGRLIYTGAGTSGRLAVVDASEMPPTFSVPPTLVRGLIAGGREAMFQAVEGAEDNVALGAADIAALDVGALDSVLGVAASARTPYVVGTLREARARGALTGSLCCSAAPAPVHDAAEIAISLLTGPEVITGSTRMKAGTATKLALNMISTTAMIRLGKTYGNLMVDLQASNTKLRDRARRIVEAVTGLPAEEAQRLLTACGNTKTAIVAGLTGCDCEEAQARLSRAGGQVRRALTGASAPGPGPHP